jgi:hypothetical protein
MAGVPILHHHSAQAPRLFSRGIHPRSLPRFFTTIVENKLGAKAELLRTPVCELLRIVIPCTPVGRR